MKKCSRCREQKLLSEFYSEGRQGYCKMCACQYKRDNYDPHKRKMRELKLQYNLSTEDYEALIEKGCFCGSKENLVIDHDHACCPERKRSCGKCIRGALCSNHNCLLGFANDDIEILTKAIDYLKENYRDSSRNT